MANETLHQAAMVFLFAHQAQHLSRDRDKLIERCIEHIRATSDTSLPSAEVITLQALGDIQSRSTGAYVDLDRTTSYAVFLTDPSTGKRACITAAALLRLFRDHTVHADLRDCAGTH